MPPRCRRAAAARRPLGANAFGLRRYLRTSEELKNVFAYFVDTGAFVEDLREEFEAETLEQVALCDEAIQALIPPGVRTKVDTLLVAEVLLGVKHDVFVEMHKSGVISVKDREILHEDLLEAEEHLKHQQVAAQREVRRASAQFAQRTVAPDDADKVVRLEAGVDAFDDALERGSNR